MNFYRPRLLWFSLLIITAIASTGCLPTKKDPWPDDFSFDRMPIHQKEFDWYKIAAQQGNVDAQQQLGFVYSHGFGPARTVNYAEAAKWYALAAEQGNIQAQFQLSVMYFQGQGVPKDGALAYKWASITATLGHPNGVEFRDVSAALLSNQQISEGERLAREWFLNRDLIKEKAWWVFW